MFYSFTFKNILFSLLLTIFQIALISSADEKCFSIKNCAICPELDICEKCLEDFILNESKTKCKSSTKSKKTPKKKEIQKEVKKPTPPPAPVQPVKVSPSPVKSNSNPFLQKPSVSVNKAPNNPFQNIPTPSFQRFKDKEANNALINKILIFILIVLVLSIIVSLINNFLKKRGTKSYFDDEGGQEESSKVVYIH